MDTGAMGADRGINPPGRSATVAAMLDALAAVAGAEARAKVGFAFDREVFDIVAGWPAAFAATRARALGFVEQESLEDLVRAFVEDDLAATRAERGL
jgi:nucleoside-diphosphate-sugar epimerase